MSQTRLFLVVLALVMIIMTSTVSAARRFSFVQDDLNEMVRANNHLNVNAGKNELAMVTFPPADGRLALSIENIAWSMTSPSNFTIQFNNVKVSKCDIIVMAFGIDRSSTKNDGLISNLGALASYDSALQQSVIRNFTIKFPSPLSNNHDFEIKAICTYTELLDDVQFVRGGLTLLANNASISTLTQSLLKLSPFSKTSIVHSQYCRPNAAGDRVIFPSMVTRSTTQQITSRDKIFFTELISPRSMNATTCNFKFGTEEAQSVQVFKDMRYQSRNNHGFGINAPTTIPAGTDLLLNCYLDKNSSHYYGPVDRPMFWMYQLVDQNGAVKATSYYYTTDGTVSCGSW